MRASTCASLRGLTVCELALGVVEACELGAAALGADVIGAALGAVVPDCACASGVQARPEPIAAAAARARMVREAVMFPSLAGFGGKKERAKREGPKARDGKWRKYVPERPNSRLAPQVFP